MTWELYEVWSVDEQGNEDLIDTTKSLKEAKQLAASSLENGVEECVIYQEDDTGELVEVDRMLM